MLDTYKKTLFILCLCGFTHIIYGQEPIVNPGIKFGEFNLTDLEMKSYDKDSSADALILYDYGQTSFDNSLGPIYQHFIYHRRIKILRKSALDLGTISLQLIKGGSGREQKISDIKGFTYNLQDGGVKMVKLGKESIFIEKTVGEIQNVKIIMPNVKEGSVIEFSYIITTPFSISRNPTTWVFQETNPVMWSIYELVNPDYLNYNILLSGYLKLTKDKPEQISERIGDFFIGGQLHRFIIKDAPAFRDEAYITNPGDYISKIDFELASIGFAGFLTQVFPIDYTTMNQNMIQNYMLGAQLKNTSFLAEAAKEIKSRFSDSTSRLKAACEYVRKNVKWNEQFSIYSKDLKKVLETHIGDSGDINLLLVALLREIGFDANPVILSTRDHGKIDEQHALVKRFNYVVAHIGRNGKNFLMDATDEYLKLGMLPVHCLNGLGWLIHPTNPGFIQITPVEKDVQLKNAYLVLNEEGNLNGVFTISYNGYSDVKEKKDLKVKGQNKYLDDARKQHPDWVIEKATYSKNDSHDEVMSAEYQISVNDFITKAGNMLYLKPMLSEAQKENLLKAKQRLYPIDFIYPTEKAFMVTYELPKGYSIVDLPNNISIALPQGAGRFNYTITANSNKIILTSRVQLRKAVFSPEEYSSLQEFFDKIVAKHQEQVVLKKI